MVDHALEPSRPSGRAERGRGGAQVHGQARRARLLQQPQRHERVVALVGARERAHAAIGEARRAYAESVGRLVHRDAGAGLDQARAHGGRIQGDGFVRFGRKGTQHGGASRAEHAGLLVGDGAERRAEVGLVVLLDAHDGGGQRRDDVGRVEPPSHPDLQHRHVHALAAEVVEAGGGEDLEVGGMGGDRARADEALGGAAHALDRGLERGRSHVAPAHRDALVDAHQVGRGVAAHHEARRAERGIGVGHDRSLPVGAGHEQRRERALGMLQFFAERPHRLQTELDAETDATRQVGGGAGAAAGGPGRHRGRDKRYYNSPA